MGKVLAGMTMSLDGFIEDRNGSVARLYPDLDALRQTDLLQEEIRRTGAVVMGRRAYDTEAADVDSYRETQGSCSYSGCVEQVVVVKSRSRITDHAEHYGT